VAQRKGHREDRQYAAQNIALRYQGGSSGIRLPGYLLRWGAEEAYKCDKLRLELENFSGLRARVVLQDRFAKLFTLNPTAICVVVAQAIPTERYRQRHREYRVNFAHTLSEMKNTVVLLLVGAGTSS